MRPIVSMLSAVAVVCVAGGSVLVSGQSTEMPTDAPATLPAEPTTKPARVRPIRLTVPWNKVPDLTDEQKTQINAIHVETIAKIKELEAAEDEACMALLTAEQRAALEETLAREAAEKKAKSTKKKAE